MKLALIDDDGGIWNVCNMDNYDLHSFRDGCNIILDIVTCEDRMLEQGIEPDDFVLQQ